MSVQITYTDLPITHIVYDHSTRLFPFSPRREVDAELVARLKRSMSESGIWQPVVVRAGTLEGIAGNHRYLASLELAQEAGQNLEQVTIPAMLIDCDDGLAVSIALMENEIRQELTQWETVRALLKAAKRKPKTVETVFQVDGETIQQLRLWEGQLDYEAEIQRRRRELQSRLTRDWLRTINERLAEYPELCEKFMGQLQYPSWVRARTLDELNDAITQALIEQGVQFAAGSTWNAQPAAQCLGQALNWNELRTRLGRGDLEGLLDVNSALRQGCPHLCLRPQYTRQFVPAADGPVTLPILENDAHSSYPPQALASDGQGVRGDYVLLLNDLAAYCIAPDVQAVGGCLHRLEAAAAEAAVGALRQQGLPAVLPEFIRQREKRDEFCWRGPQIEGQPCTPAACPHAGENPPSCVLVLHPGERTETWCTHAACGEAAQAALVDWEAEQRRQEQQRLEQAVHHLRRVSVERTLLATPEQAIRLTAPQMLYTIESLLVPEWDTASMLHILLGWQAAQAGEHSALPRPRMQDGEVLKAFEALRAEVVQSEADLPRWVTCLAVVRGWRDRVNTMDEVSHESARLADSLA